jgi:hypothetical protein
MERQIISARPRNENIPGIQTNLSSVARRCERLIHNAMPVGLPLRFNFGRALSKQGQSDKQAERLLPGRASWGYRFGARAGEFRYRWAWLVIKEPRESAMLTFRPLRRAGFGDPNRSWDGGRGSVKNASQTRRLLELPATRIRPTVAKISRVTLITAPLQRAVIAEEFRRPKILRRCAGSPDLS